MICEDPKAVEISKLSMWEPARRMCPSEEMINVSKA